MYEAYVIGRSEHDLLTFKRDSEGKIRKVVFANETFMPACIIYNIDEAKAIIDDLQMNYNEIELHIYQLGAVKEIA